MAAGRFVVPPYFPARNRENQLLAGALLYVYENNTTTKVVIYTDEALTVPASNPVVANASGQFPATYAEAGTEASPVLYSVSITTATGASPGNPFNFDNYRPSVDWETAAVALAEAAADQAGEYADDSEASAVESAASAAEAAADLAEIEAIISSGSDAPFIAGKLNRNGDNASAGLYAAIGEQTTALTAASDVADADLVPVYRPSGPGPLKKLTASILGNYVVKTLTAFLQAGTGAVARSLQSKARDFVSAFDYMTTAQIADVQAGTLGEDVTTALQAAIDACIASGKLLYLPAGNYKITNTLDLVGTGSAYGLNVRGEGNRYTVITLFTSSTATPAVRINLTNNSSFIGARIGGFRINAGGGAAKGVGILLNTTATNSAISQLELDNITVLNVSTGVSMNGVIYMSTFRNITVTGSVTDNGWYVASAQEIIYNTFSDLEVTAVENGAYAYYFQVIQCQFRNLTADGVMFFSNPYGCVKGVTIEGISAATTASNVAIDLNQCDSLEDVALINVPNAKCDTGIRVLGRCNINNVRWPDAGVGNQPNNPLLLTGGSKGTVIGYQTLRAVVTKVEAGSAEAEMNNWVFINCQDITDNSFSQTVNTAWTPTFPYGWTIPPTLVGARYVKTGSVVTATAYFQDGVCIADAQIGGLPFACNSLTGFAASGSSNDSTDRISGSLTTGGTTLSGIPANTLTGNFWQITVTYFV